ncbi:MAG: peptidoglycan editing factor PgeF [Pseudomonadota bacterium]
MGSWVHLTDWSLPSNVKAAYTTRLGGGSADPYDSFNLATHVGDDPQKVLKNREYLSSSLAMPSDPRWLKQVHSDKVVRWPPRLITPEADAIYANLKSAVCAVLTADCLPILIASLNGEEIAAIHAGWRGLFNGVINQAINEFSAAPDELTVWLGPRISQARYEVGLDLIDKFTAADKRYEAAIQQVNNHYFLDLAEIALSQLQQKGVEAVHDCRLCTFEQEADFFSYRRDGITGRFASLIWRFE